MKKCVPLILALGLLVAATVSADVIYSWKDEQGVRRFSSEPPPEGIKDFQKYESPASSAQSASPADERRSSYDQMAEKAAKETRRLERQREVDAAAREAEQARRAEAQRKEKIKAVRDLLEQQIEAINKRALGPNFSQGMKKAQIDKLREQIKALEKNPDAVKPPQPAAAEPSNSGY